MLDFLGPPTPSQQPGSPLGPRYGGPGCRKSSPLGGGVCFQISWVAEGCLWGAVPWGRSLLETKEGVSMVRAAQPGSGGLPWKVLRLKGSSMAVAEWGQLPGAVCSPMLCGTYVLLEFTRLSRCRRV